MNRQDTYWARASAGRFGRRRMLGLAGAGMAAAYLAACGGGSKSEEGGQQQPQTGGQTQPQAQATALSSAQGQVTQFETGKFGGRLKLATTLETGTLDTAIPLSGGDTVFLATMYNPLLTIDHFVPNPQLSLAQKYEVVDPTTLSFSLRPGVKFHDGTDFNAESVKWNISRILDPATKGAARSSIADIERVEAVDNLTVRVVLKQPNAAILNSQGLTSVYGGGMASRTAVEKWGKEFTAHPVGTGAFVFDQWVPGSHVTVKRNPNYWEKDAAGKALPYFDEVTITAIQDETVRYANLQTGDAHFARIGTKDWAAAEKHPEISLVKGLPGGGVNSVLVFNLDKAPADNLNIRKAMAFALDPSVVAKNVYFGYAEPADGGMRQKGSWSYTPVPGRPVYDVAKAKEFLKAAGKPDGFDVQIITYTSPSINQQTEIYQEQWSKVGIKATITTQDVTTGTDSFFVKGLFPAYSTSWGGTSFEPNGPATLIYAKDAYYNPMKRAVSPELDDLIVKARSTYELEERKKLYHRIDEIVLVDQCFFMPMLYSQIRGWFRKNIGNADIFPWFSEFRLQSLYFRA